MSGNPDGQFGLGLLLLEGIGVQQDYTKSFNLMQQAAMQGHAAAQFQVGQAYVNGEGVNTDYEEAYAWFLVSKKNGNPTANKGIDLMNSYNLVPQSRLNSVIERANDIYAETTNEERRNNESSDALPVSGLSEYCDMVMPTVESIINFKKYGKPRSSVEQLMEGMTDQQAIKMMTGLIDWVWRNSVSSDKIGQQFKQKCLSQSPDINFIFP